MAGEIFLADPNRDQRRTLCSLLSSQRYETIEVPNFLKLNTVLCNKKEPIVILNLDAEGVNNQFLKELTRQPIHPHVIGLSKRFFHPELVEAMSKHISICLSSPVDAEELLYWIRTLVQNHGEAGEGANP
jgi:DNA-binding NtrC family response regulator